LPNCNIEQTYILANYGSICRPVVIRTGEGCDRGPWDKRPTSKNVKKLNQEPRERPGNECVQPWGVHDFAFPSNELGP